MALGVWLGLVDPAVTVMVVVVVRVLEELAAVIVTVYVPGVVELQDRVAVPWPASALGLEQVALRFRFRLPLTGQKS